MNDDERQEPGTDEVQQLQAKCATLQREWEAMREERDLARRAAAAAGAEGPWVWTGTADDHLASMSEDMAVSITGGQLRQLVESAREDGRREALLLDQPWSIPEIVKRLCDDADHLADAHDCDHHGWEGRHHAVTAARVWLAGDDPSGVLTPQSHRLAWTRERPTVAGRYRARRHGPEFGTDVYRDVGLLWATGFAAPLHEIEDYEWAGPIPEGE